MAPSYHFLTNREPRKLKLLRSLGFGPFKASKERQFSLAFPLQDSAVRGVAQPGRAPVLGTGCRQFESGRPDHFKAITSFFKSNKLGANPSKKVAVMATRKSVTWSVTTFESPATKSPANGKLS